MGALPGNKDLDTPRSIKLSGLDLMFGLPRSEWVTLYKDTVDLDRLCSTIHALVEHFPVLKGRLIRRGAHLFVEQLDAGIEIEILDSDNPAPDMGPNVFPFLANGLVPEMPPVPLNEQEERPLTAFRIIRYQDGRVTMGSSICHGVVDAGSISLFYAAFRKAYFGDPMDPVVMDRSVVLKLADENVGAPTDKSGLMLKPFNSQLFATPPKPSDFFGMILSKADHAHLIERVKERFSGALSFNNYLQAIMMKVFAQSCEEQGGDTYANMSYDLRRMGSGFVPINYFGGATIFRSFAASFDELRHAELQEIAQRFKGLGRLTAEEIKQDVGYIQAQYEAGNINDFGSFSEFLTPLLNKGLYINNLLGLGRPIYNPASNVIWSEMPLRMPVVIRMATIHYNDIGDISFRMALPAGQRDLFLVKWTACIQQELLR